MKKIVILFLIIHITSIYAQDFYTGAGTAVEDGLFGPLVNPASVATGKTTGLGISMEYTTDNAFDNYKFFANNGFFSWILSRVKDTYYANTIYSMGGESFSLGIDVHWNLSNDTYLGWKAGSLLRPLPYVSMSYLYDSNQQMIGGLALRPLAFSKDTEELLTIAADAFFSTEGYDNTRIYATSVPVDGIEVSAGYDLATEEWFGDLSFRFGFSENGTTASFAKDGTFMQGEAYSYLSINAFESFADRAGDHNVEYSLPSAISESSTVESFGFLRFQSSDKPIYEITEELDSLANDPSVKTIVFRKPFSQMSLTQLDELVQALLRCRDAGKKIVFYSESYTLKDYILAAATADQVYLYPVGELRFSGLAAGKIFMGDFLKNNNIVVTDLKSHPYKTANNTFVENEMTPEEREALQLVLDSQYAYLMKLVENRRGDRVKDGILDAVEGTPYLIGQKALDAGLIDGLIYEDQLEDSIAEAAGDYPLYDFWSIPYRNASWADPILPKAAVIFAIGGIHSGPGQVGDSIGSDTTAAAIRSAREDASVKAIIIRVDSGGGSALASDVIAREVELCKEAGKPVVVSMASVAASGGYYIAAKADHIIAYPATITGSIGVTGALFSVGDLLKENGINYDVVKTTENADMGTLLRNPTDEEVAILMESIQYTYDTFVNLVAEGRDMTYDDVHTVAQGRIWTGEDALKAGLIDQLGGWKETIEWVKAEIGEDEISIVNFTETGWGLPASLAPELSVEDQLLVEFKAYLKQAQLIHKDGEIYLGLPYHFED